VAEPAFAAEMPLANLSTPQPPQLASGMSANSEASTIGMSPLVVDFEPWTPGTLGTIAVLDNLPLTSASRVVAQAIAAAVAAEGPIHITRLAKLVAAAFGLNKVSNARAQAILKAMPPELKPKTLEPFVWPAETDPALWRMVRRSASGDNRVLEYVPLVEIGNAMRLLVLAHAGMPEIELKREALAVFGGKRMTEQIGARLDEALRRASSSGILRRSETGLIQIEN
jgi:hypothetical protein